ncbi:Uncharacterised protein [Klebsiella pneumoniae]|nr:Uncharacterised protein [Klebsiella pneumoniae]
MSTAAASRMLPRPFISSSPMFNKATRGLAMPTTSSASTAPITANCTSIVLSQSTLAPRSSTTVLPFCWCGKTVTSAGRSIPSIGLSSSFARPISAPVLPALTQACARPSFTSSSATRIELPRLLRIACAGRASLAITDCAGIICRRERCSKSALASNGVMASGSPTKRSVSCELEFSACSAAGTVTDGPKSPPMTSNARVRRVKVSSLPGSVIPQLPGESSLSFITLAPANIHAADATIRA